MKNVILRVIAVTCYIAAMAIAIVWWCGAVVGLTYRLIRLKTKASRLRESSGGQGKRLIKLTYNQPLTVDR